MKQPASHKHYGAFISYRHKTPDRQFAHILHFMLEHNIVRPERKTSRKIRPVFLDDAELPTSEDLNEDIRQALANSDSLFVVCSPNLPLSKYCMEEIRYFKELHGGSTRRIHPLLIAGEPDESFPELLRTTIRSTADPDEDTESQVVDSEPRSADIRARNFLHSLWKLIHTEYLRLMAAYFSCPYDHLYQRHTRWRIMVCVCLVFFSLLCTWAVTTHTNNMIDNSISIAAEEALANNGPLSALTLCMDAPQGKTQRYETVLRSAAVQYDHQQSLPVSSIPLNQYPDLGVVVRYLSRDGSQIITQSSRPNGASRTLQITDARTGRIHLQEPQERVFVTGENPEQYLMLRSHEDERGTMMDYVSLMDLSDNSLVTEFAYRESSRDSADYMLVQGIENKNLLTVADGEEYIAFLKTDGTQLTREEFIRLALEYVNDPLPPENAPWQLVRKRRQYILTDADGNQALTLDYQAVTAFDFSDDYSLFAWSEEDRVYIFDLLTQSQLAASRYPQSTSSKLVLLDGSTYYAVQFMENGEPRTYIYDWRTGACLLKLDAFPIFSSAEQSFFITENAQIIRYDYHSLDLSAKATVKQQTGQKCLALGTSSVILLDTQANSTVFRIASADAGRTRWDDALEHILIPLEDRIACYGGSGALLWEKPLRPELMAVSADGTLAAWTCEDGCICAADCDSGAELYRLDLEAPGESGTLTDLSISSQGICISTEMQTDFYPRDTASPIQTEAYSQVQLTSDQLLILWDDDARVRDFSIYDPLSGKPILQPKENTEKWVYSANSGYLIRHTETSGNSASYYLEVLKRTKDGFELQTQIPLTHTALDYLHLDSTGRWLSYTCGGRTVVCHLPNAEKWLDAAGTLFYENGSIYSDTVYADGQYHITPGSPEELKAYASQVLTSSWGIRLLSQEERELLSILY